MSQRRRRIRRQVSPIGPTKREKTVAVLGVACVVGLTSLAVWAMRPGTPDDYGLTGGIANRQPTATWLVVLSAAALVGSVLFFRSRAAAGRGPARRPWLGVSHLVIVAAAVIIGFVWPGGLLRHGPPPPTDLVPADLTTVAPIPTPTSTAETSPGESTVAPTTVTASTTP